MTLLASETTSPLNRSRDIAGQKVSLVYTLEPISVLLQVQMMNRAAGGIVDLEIQRPATLPAGAAGVAAGLRVCFADSTSAMRLATMVSSPGSIIDTTIDTPVSPSGVGVSARVPLSVILGSVV